MNAALLRPIYTTGILAIAASSSFAQYPTYLQEIDINKEYQIDGKAPEEWITDHLGSSSFIQPQAREVLSVFASNLIGNLEDIDPDIYKLVEDNFWELI